VLRPRRRFALLLGGRAGEDRTDLTGGAADPAPPQRPDDPRLSRQKNGIWEYHGKAGWKELAAGAVASSILESARSSGWNTKKPAAAPSDLPARSRTADWALSAGLAAEGLEEMTAVLALDPDRREVPSPSPPTPTS
jgi:hypothetical protein